MNKPICPFCNDAPAMLLCDRVIGMMWSGEMAQHEGREWRTYATGDNAETFTCDRPICESCATTKGGMHIAYSNRRHVMQTLDYCPLCRDHPEDETQGPVTKSEAEAWRRQRLFVCV